MNTQNVRRDIAQKTVQILDKGEYESLSGKKVKIHETLDRARRLTRTFSPDELEKMTIRHVFNDKGTPPPPSITVTNETTLSAALRLAQKSSNENLMALNFASAKNPGGGFLNGASAQEESLCRKSGLYHCIKDQAEYYEQNKAYGSSLYTDHMIYSPGVPVIRDVNEELLESPYLCDFITAPAVNAGAVRENEPKRVNMIQPVMEQRIEKLIALFVHLSQKRLVLGAWGCGVFGNDPTEVARWFSRYLGTDSPYAPYIDEVVFAVLDNTADKRIITPFRNEFE